MKLLSTALMFMSALWVATIVAASTTIVVTQPWSRPAVETAVVYATIANHSDRSDRLVGASSPLAERVELHESQEAAMPMDSMAGMTMPGGSMVSMKALSVIAIPANGVRILKPGGYHLMLVGLRHALKASDVIALRLHFARAGWVVVAVPVR